MGARNYCIAVQLQYQNAEFWLDSSREQQLNGNTETLQRSCGIVALD